MAIITAVNRLILQRIRPTFQRRLVSTSKKNNDTVAADVCKTVVKDEKNWVSYGYNTESKSTDRFMMHAVMFTGFSLCLVVAGFIWAYAPDLLLRDWAVREGFLELKRREAAGLPLVDPNLIPPEKIVLPTDEELGDTEIII